MESTRFIVTSGSNSDQNFLRYKVSLLPAYAINYSVFEHTNIIQEAYEIPTYRLEHDELVVDTSKYSFPSPISTGVLTIYHHGIKDYRLLFPHMANDSLATRLGQFAEEAETAFKNAAWLSYSLMVAAVIEGLLYNLFGNTSLNQLIAQAKNKTIITDEEAELFKKSKDLRNLVHANRHDQDFAERSAALELSVSYDKLLKMDWEKAKLTLI
jgi:hypothetical protein